MASTTRSICSPGQPGLSTERCRMLRRQTSNPAWTCDGGPGQSPLLWQAMGTRKERTEEVGKRPSVQRCRWVTGGSPLYMVYHDREWGKPQHDELVLFEFLILEDRKSTRLNSSHANISYAVFCLK